MTDQLRVVDAFKTNLRFLMFELGLTQEALGEKLGGMSRQNINNLLKSEDIRTSTIGKVAAALGYEETDLTDPNFKSKYFLNKNVK
jgi:transcriptional regulator with XRE-family HTH domain